MLVSLYKKNKKYLGKISCPLPLCIMLCICLAYQQDQIRELEPLRSHLRLVKEECERKIQARWGEEQAEIGALKREKQQLQLDMEAMRENEKALQAVVHGIIVEWNSNCKLFLFIKQFKAGVLKPRSGDRCRSVGNLIPGCSGTL